MVPTHTQNDSSPRKEILLLISQKQAIVYGELLRVSKNSESEIKTEERADRLPARLSTYVLLCVYHSHFVDRFYEKRWLGSFLEHSTY